jgi:sulfite reductase (NADPH) hemoprotein beta-component
VGFLEPQHLEEVAKAVITIHRDFGDRTNRKHARLKYVIAERGVKWFKQEVEHRVKVELQPARPYQFTRQGDLLGWHQQTNGNWFLGLFVENGRVLDKGGYRLKTGLRTLVERFRPEARLTASQNVLFVNVRGEDREAITRLLAEHGVSVDNPFSRTRMASMACPALPTCGLALAESERMLPDMITQLEQLLKETGLDSEEFIIRSTGCPNGCARPYTAEIALVGKGPGRYQLYFGGNEGSTRLARVYKDVVKAEELMNELRPLLTRYAQERQPGERFGDFSERVLFNTAVA